MQRATAGYRSGSASWPERVIAAGGMSIVAVLVLRALGEWRELQDRQSP